MRYYLTCAALCLLAACGQPAEQTPATPAPDATAPAATANAPITAVTAYAAGWRAVADGTTLTVEGDGIAPQTLTASRTAQARGAQYTAGTTVLTVEAAPCTDSAGQPVEFTARLTLDGKAMPAGCAVRGALPQADS